MEVRGGWPMADAADASAARVGFTVRAAAVGSTVGFRFARDKKLIDPAGGVGAKSMAASFGGGTKGLVTRADPQGSPVVSFMPPAVAPPPPEVAYPPGYSNELELVEAAIKKACTVTNFFTMDKDDAARAARDELVRHWVEEFRKNGIPEAFTDRRRAAEKVEEKDAGDVKVKTLQAR